MILCKPERNAQKAVTMLIVYSLVSISLSIFSSSFPNLQPVFAVLFFGATAILIMLLYRYVFSQYIYQLTLTELVIIRSVGRRSTTVGSLSLEDSKLLISKEMFFKNGHDKDFFNLRETLDCCQNLASSCYYYICGEDGKECLLKFEPNEVFVRAMNENISNLKHGDK